MVNGITRRILDELGESATVIVTGGVARQILDKLEYAPHYEPDLTLEGLRILYEMNVPAG